MAKKEMWVITATVVTKKKVDFGEPVADWEAIERYMDGDYEDILDEDEVRVVDAEIKEGDYEE